MKVIPRHALEPAKGITYSDAHLRRLEIAGKFPKPIRLGKNKIAYPEDEIDAWLEEKRRERDSEHTA